MRPRSPQRSRDSPTFTERGVLTDDEFQEAKQRVLRDRDSEAATKRSSARRSPRREDSETAGLMAEVTRGR